MELSKRQLAIGCSLMMTAMALPTAATAAGFANTAHSATSVGMGGVGTANPNEPNSNFFNPASMSYDEDWNLYVGSTFLLPSAQYTSPDGDIQTDAETELFYPPNFNLSVPLTDELTAGVGLTFPWGLGVAWPSDWHGRENFRSQSLETLNLNPNVAYQVGDTGLSVAAGVQLMRSALRQERAAIVRDDTEVDVILGGVGYGIGGTFGAMYQANEDVTVGLHYRSATGINYEGRAHFSDDVEGTPFESRMVDQDISTQITMPHVVNAGVGWQLSDPVWLGLDVNYMTWSTYDEVRVEYSEQSPEGEPGETEPPTVQEGNWNDAVAVRLGGQYTLTDALTARAGLAFDMTPVPDETVGPSLPDNNRVITSAGVGYGFDAFRADLGYQYIFVAERVIDNGNVDGTYQMSSHVLGLNFGYGF